MHPRKPQIIQSYDDYKAAIQNCAYVCTHDKSQQYDHITVTYALWKEVLQILLQFHSNSMVIVFCKCVIMSQFIGKMSRQNERIHFSYNTVAIFILTWGHY